MIIPTLAMPASAASSRALKAGVYDVSLYSDPESEYRPVPKERVTSLKATGGMRRPISCRMVRPAHDRRSLLSESLEHLTSMPLQVRNRRPERAVGCAPTTFTANAGQAADQTCATAMGLGDRDLAQSGKVLRIAAAIHATDSSSSCAMPPGTRPRTWPSARRLAPPLETALDCPATVPNKHHHPGRSGRSEGLVPVIPA